MSSHGVLTLQIITRNFPNPGDATRTIEDRRFPTGRVNVFIPEIERRKKDIDLVEPAHLLLPMALDCLKDRDSERLSADELCGRLASLKREPRYIHSVEQTRGHIQKLQQEVDMKSRELERERANHQQSIQEKDELLLDRMQVLEQLVSSRDNVRRRDETIRKLRADMDIMERELQKASTYKEYDMVCCLCFMGGHGGQGRRFFSYNG